MDQHCGFWAFLMDCGGHSKSSAVDCHVFNGFGSDDAAADHALACKCNLEGPCKTAVQLYGHNVCPLLWGVYRCCSVAAVQLDISLVIVNLVVNLSLSLVTDRACCCTSECLRKSFNILRPPL